MGHSQVNKIGHSPTEDKFLALMPIEDNFFRFGARKEFSVKDLRFYKIFHFPFDAFQ